MDKPIVHTHDEAQSGKLITERSIRFGKVKRTLTILVIVFALVSWWQGFGNSIASIKYAAVFVNNGIASVLTLKKLNIAVGDELSTANAGSIEMNEERVSNSLWQVRKSVPGESIWSVYRTDIVTRHEAGYQSQTINGLKNLTILKNNIAREKIAHGSLAQNKEYSFLHQDAQKRFAEKIIEANKKLQAGAHLKDMDNSVRLAYLVANAPSYDFLYSLPSQDIQNLLE